MPAQVTPVLSNPDPTWNPTNLAQLWAFLNLSFETVNVSGGPFTPYVISSTTPAVADQDKVWEKVDGNGRPLGRYLFYNGNWRKEYTGNPTELRMFSGDPSTYFDNTGLGIVGGEWDGWAICNGQNGTDNWSDLFPVFGRMDNAPITGYNAGWQTNVTGAALKTGGSSTYQIQNTDLPSMKVFARGRHYNAGASNTAKKAIVEGGYDGNDNFDTEPLASFGADPSGSPPVVQTTVPIAPPFKAACLVKFVGYT